VCLFFSLADTLWGLMPAEGRFNIYTTGGIEKYKRFEAELAERKATATKGAVACLLLAVIVAVLGLMTRL